MKKWMESQHLLALALIFVLRTSWAGAADPSPVARLFSESGTLRGEYATLNEAFKTAANNDKVILLRDVTERVVIDKRSWNNTTAIEFKLAGHQLKGSLEIYDVWLSLVADGQPKSRFRAGDLEEIIAPTWSKGGIILYGSMEMDLSQTDLSNYFDPIETSDTDAVITVPQGFERNLKYFVGSVRVVVNDDRLAFGYEPIDIGTYTSPDRVSLWKSDGSRLPTDTNGCYRVPGVKVWHYFESSRTPDLSDPTGWDGGVLPTPNDRAIVYLSYITDELNFGANGTLAVKDLYLVMPDQDYREEGWPPAVALNGTLNIGAGKGRLISDVNLHAQPGQILCGVLEIGYKSSVTVFGEQMIAANLSGLGRLNLAENAKITLTGSNRHSGGLIANGVRVQASRLSQLGTSRLRFGTDRGGSPGTPSAIEVTVVGDTDDSEARIARIVESGGKGSIRFSGTGVYTIPPVDLQCRVINDLADGFRLSAPGEYTFITYSGEGGFRLDQLPQEGTRTLHFIERGGSYPNHTRLSTILRPDLPITAGTQVALFLDNQAGGTGITLSGNYPAAGYAPMRVWDCVHFAKGTSWGTDLILNGGWQTTVSGSGTIAGDLIVTDRVKLSAPLDGVPIAVQGSLKFTSAGGRIVAEMPRNVSEGDSLLSIGGLEANGELTYEVDYPFEECLTFGPDDAAHPRAIVVKEKLPVASVNGTAYKSLRQAYAAAPSGGEIHLLRSLFEDVTNTSPLTVRMDGKDMYGSMTAYADLFLEGGASAGGYPGKKGPGEGATLSGKGRDALTVGRPGIMDQNIRVRANLTVSGPESPDYVCMRLNGGTTTLSGFCEYNGDSAAIAGVAGGNANLVVTDCNMYLKSGPAIRWESLGTLDFLKGNIDGWIGIEALAGTVNLSGGRIHAYFDPYGPQQTEMPEHVGAAVAILQTDPDHPVTFNISGEVELGGIYSLYEKSVIQPKPLPQPLSLLAATSPVWPTITVTGGEFRGEQGIYSASVEQGMPPFITGGTFSGQEQLTGLLAEGYKEAPKLSESRKRIVYPLPAGGEIIQPEGSLPLNESTTAFIMSALGKPAQGTTATEVRFPASDPEAMNTCISLGIAPKASQEGSVQVASFATPKLTITDFYPTSGTVVARLIPQAGTAIREKIPDSALQLMTTDDLSVPMVRNTDFSVGTYEYLKPETLGKIRFYTGKTTFPRFYRVVIQTAR